MTITILLIIVAVVGILLFLIKLTKKHNDDVSSISNTNNFADKKAIESLLLIANERLIIKDYKMAISIADKILQLFPNNCDALITRGNGLGALNFHLDAIDDYERALTINNYDSNIYGLLGLQYSFVGNFESALKNLKISIQKGSLSYEFNYIMLSSMSDAAKQITIERAKNKNLLRRDQIAFNANFSEVDRNTFKETVKNSLPQLETWSLLDPHNKNLKELYDYAKTLL